MAMMRARLLIITALLLLSACSSIPSEAIDHESGTASIIPTAETDIGSNERMPTTIDSLEVRESQRVSIPVTLTESGHVLLGDASAPRLTITTDPRCSYCRDFILQDLPWLEDTYLAHGTLALDIVYAAIVDDDPSVALLHRCAASLGKHNEIASAYAADPTIADASKSTRLRSLMGKDVASLAVCTKDAGQIEAVKHASKTVDRVPAFSIGDTAWIGLATRGRLRSIIDAAREHKLR